MTTVTPAGMTIRTNLDSVFIGVASADLNVSTIQTNQSSTWGDGAATSWMVIVAAFKAAATAPVTPTVNACVWVDGVSRFYGNVRFQ